MKTYYVIKHDFYGDKDVNTERGYYVSVNPDSFRNLPVTAIIWSVKVEAESKQRAISKAKSIKNKTNLGNLL